MTEGSQVPGTRYPAAGGEEGDGEQQQKKGARVSHGILPSNAWKCGQSEQAAFYTAGAVPSRGPPAGARFQIHGAFFSRAVFSCNR